MDRREPSTRYHTRARGFLAVRDDSWFYRRRVCVICLFNATSPTIYRLCIPELRRDTSGRDRIQGTAFLPFLLVFSLTRVFPKERQNTNDLRVLKNSASEYDFEPRR